MKINGNAVHTWVSRGLLVIPLLTVALATAPSLADQVRLYTNADLKALDTSSAAKEKKAVTNSDLKSPLPSQSKSLAHSASDDANWDSVLAFIDRERAYIAKTRENDIAYQKMLMQTSQLEREMTDCRSHSYYYPWYPFFGHFGRFSEFNIPSNPSQSLGARDIRTAQDLFRESVSDSQIRRSNLP